MSNFKYKFRKQTNCKYVFCKLWWEDTHCEYLNIISKMKKKMEKKYNSGKIRFSKEHFLKYLCYYLFLLSRGKVITGDAWHINTSSLIFNRKNCFWTCYKYGFSSLSHTGINTKIFFFTKGCEKAESRIFWHLQYFF